jgi:hypothetical protein
MSKNNLSMLSRGSLYIALGEADSGTLAERNKRQNRSRGFQNRSRGLMAQGPTPTSDSMKGGSNPYNDYLGIIRKLRNK